MFIFGSLKIEKKKRVEIYKYHNINISTKSKIGFKSGTIYDFFIIS